MGPYDQNEKLPLNLQLPDSNLKFTSYTKFHHDGDDCFKFSMVSYKRYDDLNKIRAYRNTAKMKHLEEICSDESGEDDEKIYTCQHGKCSIPCPCPQCSADHEQCKEHRIEHNALFDDEAHAISIRSSEEYCLGKIFFKKSYILKYPGIPLKCEKCTQDLLIHHSYHFESHDNCCRFCKQTWFKLKATTEKELRLLEKDEAKYFKTVCPYCDRRFVQAHHV